MQPDPTDKRIFGHEFMVEELMRWFVADLQGARELVDALAGTRMTWSGACGFAVDPKPKAPPHGFTWSWFSSSKPRSTS